MCVLGYMRGCGVYGVCPGVHGVCMSWGIWGGGYMGCVLGHMGYVLGSLGCMQYMEGGVHGFLGPSSLPLGMLAKPAWQSFHLEMWVGTGWG